LEILEISKFYPPEYGGIENHVKKISHELRKLKYQIKILCFTNNNSKTGNENGIEIHREKVLISISNAPISMSFFMKVLFMKKLIEIGAFDIDINTFSL